MKQVNFNENLGHLVDKEGEKYEGQRFDQVTGKSNTYSSEETASIYARVSLLKEAHKKKADAYEVIRTQTFDSKQEYDTHPFSASVSAILYKNR